MFFAGSCGPPVILINTGLLHGPFLFQPVETEFFPHREGYPSLCGPQKIPGKAAQTWSLKMLNRIRVFPQNLALGMKTHRINEIIKDVMRHPGEGIGKPEKPRDNLSGYWSRRIDQENRFVYRVEGDILYIAQLRFHY